MLSLLGGCAVQPAALEGGFPIEASPIPLDGDDPARDALGPLHYLGGLRLNASDRRFGGLSALRWRDGRLYAVNDFGMFLALPIMEKGERLIGLPQALVVPLPDMDGRPFSAKADGDSESLDMVRDCSAQAPGCVLSITVGFERNHRIWRYVLENGRPVRPVEIGSEAMRHWLKSQPFNSGVEAMVMTGADQLWLSEGLRTADGRVRAWWHRRDAAGRTLQDREITMAFPQGFSPTDADRLDEGRFLILGRHFSVLDGVSAVLVMASLDPASGAIMTRRLATFRPPVNVDNMEGLAVRHQGGRTFVYLLSDDNFNPAQRTLLLKFELRGQQ